MPCSIMNPSNSSLKTDDHQAKMNEVFSSFEFSNFLHNRGLSDILASSESLSRVLKTPTDTGSDFANAIASTDSLAPTLNDGSHIFSSDTATKRRRTSQATPAEHQDKDVAGLLDWSAANDEGQRAFDSFSQSSADKCAQEIQDSSLMPPSREDSSFSVFRKASHWLSQQVKENATNNKEEDNTRQTKERPVWSSNKRSLSAAFSSQDWMRDYQPSHVEIKYAPTQVFDSQDISALSWSKNQERSSSPFPGFTTTKSNTVLGSHAASAGWLQGYYQQVAETKPQAVKSLPVADEEQGSLPHNHQDVTPITTSSSNTSIGFSSLGLQNKSQSKLQGSSKNSNRRGRTATSKRSQKQLINKTSISWAAVEPEMVEKKYVEPTDTDVLLGRGGRSNNHPGNKKYREEVQKLKDWYKSSNKNEKTDLSQLLVESVRSNLRGRFLQRDDNGKYFEVSKEVARKKASQALREENTAESRRAKREKYGKNNSTKGTVA